MFGTKLSRFAKFAWGVLAFNILVILWGAYVRASGSGAGCGSHWPLCNGEVVPRAARIETVIEFIHRLTSGMSLILVVILIIWAYRAYAKGSNVRLGATLSMIFIITEALVGAGLVLFEWVAQDASVGRAVSIVIHLVNTFLLLASLTLTAWWASGGKPISLEQRGARFWLILVGLIVALSMGASGALAALGDTLFPASSLAEGIQQDFSPTAHFLLRLRVLHPTIAISGGIFLLFFAGYFNLQNSNLQVKNFARMLSMIIAIQFVAGVSNLFLLAPIWLQMVHLLLADAVWIILVLFATALLTTSSETADSAQSLAGMSLSGTKKTVP